jgi:hypothetical protein
MANANTNNSTADEQLKLIRLSVADKINIICDNTTNIEQLKTLRDIGFKINRQSGLIFKQFSYEKPYHEDYLKTLIEMGYSNMSVHTFSKYDLGIKTHIPYNKNSIIYQMLKNIPNIEIDVADINNIFGKTYPNRYFKSMKFVSDTYPYYRSTKLNDKQINQIKMSSLQYKHIFELSNLDFLDDLLNHTPILYNFNYGNLIEFYKVALESKPAVRDEYINKINNIITKIYKHGIPDGTSTIISGSPKVRNIDGNLIELVCVVIEDSSDYTIIYGFMQLLMYLLELECKHENQMTTPLQSTITKSINAYTKIVNIGINKFNDQIRDKFTEEQHEMYKNILIKMLETIDRASFEKSINDIITNGHIFLLEIFVKHTKNTNYLEGCSKFLLDAAQKGNDQIIKILLESNADVDYSNLGDTALKIACRRGDLITAQLLVDNGADILKWNEKFTPYKSILDTAKTTAYRNDDLVAFLEKKLSMLGKK